MLRTPCCSKPLIMPCFTGFYQSEAIFKVKTSLLVA